jgi:hypothetical protein
LLTENEENSLKNTYRTEINICTRPNMYSSGSKYLLS